MHLGERISRERDEEAADDGRSNAVPRRLLRNDDGRGRQLAKRDPVRSMANIDGEERRIERRHGAAQALEHAMMRRVNAFSFEHNPVRKLIVCSVPSRNDTRERPSREFVDIIQQDFIV